MKVGPIEVHVQPVQIQPPKEDLHVTATGIPEKITFHLEEKSVPLDLHWPKEPLNISVDLKNGSTKPRETEFQKIIDTFSQLNRECREQLSQLNKRLTDAEQKREQLQQTVDSSSQQNDKYQEQITGLNNNLTEARARLAQQNKIYSDELDHLRKDKKITQEEFGEMKRRIENHGQKSPTEMFWWILGSGLLGGLSIGIINALERKKDNSAETGNGARGTGDATNRQDTFSDKLRKTHQRGWRSFIALLPDMLRGIVAALLLPAALYFKPGKLEIAADNHYALISLYSLCFVAAMLGKTFIDAVLSISRSWLGKSDINNLWKSKINAVIEPGNPPATVPMHQHPLEEGLAAMAKGSSLVMGWALAILGATAVGIVYGKYLHPSGPFRYVYLLFLPGWVLLANSIRYGEKVTRRLAASAFAQMAKDDERLMKIGEGMNTEYAKQRQYFQLSLLTFGAWLLALLIWWILTGDIPAGR